MSDLTMHFHDKHSFATKPMPPTRPQQFPRVEQATVEENGRVLYAPSQRMQTPTVINHDPVHSEFDGSDLHRFGPDVNPHSLYHPSVYFNQNNERFEADKTRQMMRQPRPRYQVEAPFHSYNSFQHDNQHLAAATHELRQENLTLAPSRNDGRPRSLWRPEADERFGGLNRHRYGPVTNPPAPYPESEYLSQEKRRIGFDDGVNSYHPEASVRYDSLNSAASRNNGPPRPLGPQGFNSSYHSQPGPYTNPHVPNPEREYFRHDRRRIEVVDEAHTIVRQPFPSHHPEALSRKENLSWAVPRNKCAPKGEECFVDSNRPRYGPFAHPHAYNPVNDCSRQNRKRLKVDTRVHTMRQPYPSYYQPEIPHNPVRSFQRDSQHIFRKDKTNPSESIIDVANSHIFPRLEGDGRIRETTNCVAGHDETFHYPDPKVECIQDRKKYTVDCPRLEGDGHIRETNNCVAGHDEIFHLPDPKAECIQDRKRYTVEYPRLEGDGRIRETNNCVAGHDEISHYPDPKAECIQDRKKYTVEYPRLEGDGHIRETNNCAAGHDEISHNPNPNPEVECIQDRKRYKVDDGAQSYPAYQPQRGYSFEHGIVPVVGEPMKDNPGSSDRPHLLWVPEDKEHLTELHCFVRKYCVFIFSATKKDVGSE
jgi:hypothetical protein